MKLKFKNKKIENKYLLETINDLKKDIIELYDLHSNDFLSLIDARKRDYIVRTKYLGKLVNQKLIDKFKKELKEITAYSFDELCNHILNFNFKVHYKGIVSVDDPHPDTDILDIFYDRLIEYENYQLILDDCIIAKCKKED